MLGWLGLGGEGRYCRRRWRIFGARRLLLVLPAVALDLVSLPAAVLKPDPRTNSVSAVLVSSSAAQSQAGARTIPTTHQAPKPTKTGQRASHVRQPLVLFLTDPQKNPNAFAGRRAATAAPTATPDG